MRRTGGGVFIAIGLLAGAAIGVVVGQPSLGLVGGLVAGIAVAGLIAVWEARRR